MKKEIGNENRLKHILEAINEIEEFTSELTLSEFLNNNLVKSATVRQLQIIGEAANHLSDELKNKYSEINWYDVRGFRNIIVHEYFIVDYGLVWSIVSENLLTLKNSVNNILKKEFNN